MSDEMEKLTQSEEAVSQKPDYVSEIISILESNLPKEELSLSLRAFHEADLADALEGLNKDDRLKLYRILGDEMVSEIFSYLEDVEEYIEELSLNRAADIIEEMDASEALDVLEELDEEKREQIIELLDEESLKEIELIDAYDEDQIGSKMTTNFVTIGQSFTIKEATKSVITQAAENDNISTVYVVNADQTFFGATTLRDLVIARGSDSLLSIVTTAYPFFYADEQVDECIERLKDLSEDSIPILSRDNKILGVITGQELVEVVDEELSDDYAKLAGLTEEEDLDEPVLTSVKKRLPWLLILMGLGLLVSTVIGTFDPIINAIPFIFYFQTLILNMSGNSGTQSLAVTIRVIAQDGGRKKWQLVAKELKVGLLNGLMVGLLTAAVTALYMWLLKDLTFTTSLAISGCIGLSLMTAMIVSSLSGSLIPILFKKLNIDPAVASGPMITTLNDLIAASVYYGLCYLFIIRIFTLYGL